MPPSTLLPECTASANNLKIPAEAPGNGSDSPDVFDVACASITAHVAEPGNVIAQAQLAAALRGASEAVARLPRQNTEAGEVGTARALLRSISDAAITGQVWAQLAELTSDGSPKNWPGLLARMLVKPAWHLPTAPVLGDVPEWLWGDYAAWIFTAPQPAAPAEDWDRFSLEVIRHLADLKRWVERNAGSSAVRAAADAYLRKAAGLQRAWRGTRWRTYAELRGHVLTRLLARGHEAFEPEAFPRAGRRLRVGFLQATFGPGAETCSAVPSFAQLDPQTFELFLFALNESLSDESQYCERHAQNFEVLPSQWNLQLERLRAAELDVLVFNSSLGRGLDDVTRLAVHRVAPLQVANDREGFTSGLPEIDLYVGGTSGDGSTLAGAFTERVGLLRGPSRTFDFLLPTEQGDVGYTRAELQLPDDVTLLATVVGPRGIDRETLGAWVDVLARTQHARLLVALLPSVAGDTPTRFCATIDSILTLRDVATDRVMVFPLAGQSSVEVGRLVRLSDVFLNGLMGEEPFWVAQALAAGLPVVALGNRSDGELDAGSQMLLAMGVAELVAVDRTHFAQLAVEIVDNTARRTELSARIKQAIAAGPVFLDVLAASEAFGALIETAFDELSALGRQEFRATREPLGCFCADNVVENIEAGLAAMERGEVDAAAFEAALVLRTEPTHPIGRLLRGQVLLAQGNASRAVDYLLAAVERDGGKDTKVWFALAQALRANGQTPQAIQALETCLRMDGKHVEALVLLHEMAKQVGGVEIAEETRQYLQQIAPDDPRVLIMN